MSFLETIAKAKAFLQEHRRVSLRALQREFELDDDALDELVEIQHVAVRDGKALAWADSTAPLPPASAADASIDEGVGERRPVHQSPLDAR